MPTFVSAYKLEELAKEEPTEILLLTTPNTELHIEVKDGKTIVSFPFGNRFDIISNRIFIHEA